MNSRLFRFDFDRTHFGDHGLESSTISCPADTLYSALCVEALRMGGQQLLGELVACSTLRLTDLLPYVGPDYLVPKPRDGNPHGGTWTSATIGVVGPKTPRGDGNWTQNRTGCGRCSSRQTQNPERGRKRISPATPQPRYCSMSSDPKPREGTETHRR